MQKMKVRACLPFPNFELLRHEPGHWVSRLVWLCAHGPDHCVQLLELASVHHLLAKAAAGLHCLHGGSLGSRTPAISYYLNW